MISVASGMQKLLNKWMHYSSNIKVFELLCPNSRAFLIKKELIDYDKERIVFAFLEKQKLFQMVCEDIVRQTWYFCFSVHKRWISFSFISNFRIENVK